MTFRPSCGPHVAEKPLIRVTPAINVTTDGLPNNRIGLHEIVMFRGQLLNIQNTG